MQMQEQIFAGQYYAPGSEHPVIVNHLD